MADIAPATLTTLKVTAPEIHIYKLSRLVRAPAGKWEKILNEIEQKEDITYNYYQPVREAAVKLASIMGKSRDRIFGELEERSQSVIHAPNQNPLKDNRACFETFEKYFLPKIKAFQLSLLRVPQTKGTPFGGLILKGLPHMIVTDTKDRERYVFLYPSKWQDHELDSYMELLTIVGEAQFGITAADLWCMGLKNGRTVKWNRSRARLRQDCHEAARLYKRMVEAMQP